MSDSQRKGARGRYRREALAICAHCHGTGRVTTDTATARSRRGGNVTYLASLRPDRLSMSERGRLGGRPKEVTLADLAAMDRGANTAGAQGVAPESTWDSRPDPWLPGIDKECARPSSSRT